MLLFAHLGIGLGLAWLLAWRSPARIDYRFILLGAILPDLIDKPLGAAMGLETRLWGHTFAFLFAVLAAGALGRWTPLRLLGFGVATHLLLDLIWMQPDIALWPTFGWSFPAGTFDVGRYLDILLSDPLVQTGETVGVVSLAAFAWRHRLLSWTSLRGFLADGRLPAVA